MGRIALGGRIRNFERGKLIFFSSYILPPEAILPILFYNFIVYLKIL